MDIDVLRITGLTRRYGQVIANDGISLRVRAGEVVGLLGHNGAGKTTVVSQVVGLLKPGAGDIRVGGTDAVQAPAAARRHVALQPQAQTPIDGLTPRSAIEIAGRLRGLSVRDARAAAIDLAEELDIGPWLDRRALPEGSGLSGGIRRLTGFAMAVAAPTPLLILDEPTNDIDASRRRLLWDAVRRRGDLGSGVLLVTHNVAEAERIVDELVVLDRGRLVADGSPARLRGTQDSDLRLELQLPPDGADPSESDPHLPVLRRVRTGRRILLTVAAQDAAAAVSWATAQHADDRVEGFSLAPATLEDAYLALTAQPEPRDEIHLDTTSTHRETTDA
ncbi:ABC transporter ATP-binding protein [Brachybacterium fresconis]|uniref:ABC-2 type transport system ATP-binding protein n=1 Tax=Brachybacterium fresconis TaxID=173363 RepID=A0ABS4YI18_9MICO|nr:ABC transporter ATP-binding protein [Brachybacterium fresconis]MBP2408444.1 ABC-2 type transport system ATP-binding protein [Brachybacterium fresconis]